MNKYKIYSAIIFSLLSGCGGDGDESSSSSPAPPITSYVVSANDIIHTFNVNDIGTIDLTPFTASSDGGAVYLKSLELLSGDAVCQGVVKGGNSFTLSSDQDASCVFKYTVMNRHENTQSAISRSVFRASSYAQDAQLSPLSLTLEEYQEGVVDVSDAGLHLSDSVIVLGSGTAVADQVNNKIMYTAQEAGITRVLYEMKDDAGGISLGSIDIAVSQGVNTAPAASKFSFPVSPQVIKPGEETLIDVKNYISDPDGDVVQLYNVHSFNGVAQIAYPADVTNTKIKFKSFVPGDFYVSYTITDHNGGFATNIIKVSVQGFFSSIYLAGDELHFNAPVSAEQASKLGLKVSSFPESNIPGSNGVYNSAAFNYLTAKGFCAAQGARLPTVSELAKLQLSGKAINYWPTQKYYWSYVQGAISATYQAVNISNGLTVGLSNSEAAYVTCINQQDASLPSVTYDLVLPTTMLTNTSTVFTVIYKEADNITKPFLGDLIITDITPTSANIILAFQSAGKYKLYAGPTKGVYNIKFKFVLAGHPLDGVIVTRNLTIDATTTSVITPPPPGDVWLQRDFDLSAKSNFYCGYRYHSSNKSDFHPFGIGYSNTDFAGVLSAYPWVPKGVTIPTDSVTSIRVTTATSVGFDQGKRLVSALRIARSVNGVETIHNCGEATTTGNAQLITNREYKTYTIPAGQRLTGITVFYRVLSQSQSFIGQFGFETTDIGN